jgi:hypothetical protein
LGTGEEGDVRKNIRPHRAIIGNNLVLKPRFAHQRWIKEIIGSVPTISIKGIGPGIPTRAPHIHNFPIRGFVV